jgi:trans-aconitate 2-methyltransferase
VTPLEWDAATYDRVADPQEQWAREVLDRLALRGDERVLDAGCGSGRVTRLLAELVPDGSVVAVDGSAAMVTRARENLPPEIEVLQQDLLELTLDEPVDLVFSTAVFHHIHDHDRLFERVRGVLRSGGRLVAQCGGEGNVSRFRSLAEAVAERAPYNRFLEGMPAPWRYESPAATERRLLASGFSQVRCGLQDKPTVPDDPHGFLRTVLLNYHLERLPDDLRAPYVDDVLEACGERLELDYVRLNIEAVAA